MTGRAIYVATRIAWSGRRAVVLPLGLVLILVLNPSLQNPWDVLMYATQDHQLVEIVLPLYLWIVTRDLRQPWEALVGIRQGQAEAWWAAHVGAAGVSAILVAVGLAGLAVVVPLVTHGWSWQWGPWVRDNVSRAQMASPVWQVPWRWGIATLGLLTLGLWATGTLTQLLTMWWGSPWLAWGAVVLLCLVPLALEDSAARYILWWVPGIQFSLSLHYASAPIVPAMWSVGYAVSLLAGIVGVGMILVQSSPWDMVSGGTI